MLKNLKMSSSIINVINSITVRLSHTPLIPASFADNATMIRGRIYPRRITIAIEMYELLMAEKKILKTTFKLENNKLISNNFIPEFAKAITLKFDAALKKSIIRWLLKHTNAKQIIPSSSAIINPKCSPCLIVLKFRWAYSWLTIGWIP